MGAIDVIVALLLISNVIVGGFAVAGPKVIIVGAGMSGNILNQFLPTTLSAIDACTSSL